MNLHDHKINKSLVFFLYKIEKEKRDGGFGLGVGGWWPRGGEEMSIDSGGKGGKRREGGTVLTEGMEFDL